jgi:hypothetical protein
MKKATGRAAERLGILHPLAGHFVAQTAELMQSLYDKSGGKCPKGRGLPNVPDRLGGGAGTGSAA